MTCFFVGGCQRTGTTLLQSILCSDPGTNPLIGEASYLRSLVSAYVFGKETMGTQTNDYFTDGEELREFTARWAREFLDRTLGRYAPAHHLVLKEPHLTMLFSALHELLPDARFLVMVRDPRDTIASMLKVGARLAKHGQDSVYARRDMVQLANLYKSFYAPCINARSREFAGKSLIVKYERLVHDPWPEIEKIRNFTQLTLDNADPHADWKRVQMDLSQPDPYLRPWMTELTGKGISPVNVGSYLTELTPEEVALIEAECADVIQLFRYGSSFTPVQATG